MSKERGFTPLVVIIVVVLIILGVGYFIYMGNYLNKVGSKIKNSASPAPSVELKTEYSNPFSSESAKKSEYSNPFSDYQNPFESLSE